jgi:ribosome-associated translation inhibitor RaiA
MSKHRHHRMPSPRGDLQAGPRWRNQSLPGASGPATGVGAKAVRLAALVGVGRVRPHPRPVGLSWRKPMQVQFHARGLNANTEVRCRLEHALEPLQSLAAVSVAAVVLEHRGEDGLPFRAHVSLAVPGPDIHADARAHTLEAAWLTVTESLRKQIEQRQDRRKARAKSKWQTVVSPRRWAGG